jgi:preprotein translocase subunit SecE
MVPNPITYLKQSRDELSKVVWPTKAETIKLTVVVLVISVVIGAYIAGIDAVLAKLSEQFLK